MESCTLPHASHMVWGASHLHGIAYVVVPLSSTYNSCRRHVGLLLLSLSLHAVAWQKAYLYLETAQESHRLFKVLSTCWVPLAVTTFWGCFAVLSAQENLSGLMQLLLAPSDSQVHFGNCLRFAANGSH